MTGNITIDVSREPCNVKLMHERMLRTCLDTRDIQFHNKLAVGSNTYKYIVCIYVFAIAIATVVFTEVTL